MKVELEDKRKELLEALDNVHEAFYNVSTFGGPSLYFHHRALGSNKDLERFAEAVYAALVSWGMHRMGKGGAKMREFEEFKGSLTPLWDDILKLQNVQPLDLNSDHWSTMKRVFYGIRVMATPASLVGNSKVMAHALPNLVAPVDRNYTLRFLYGSTNNVNDLESGPINLLERRRAA